MSGEAKSERTGAACGWLLLLQQLPTEPSNVRVKTWRRLQQLGAIAVRNSVYALPNRPQCREDFEWLKGEIEAMGGQASVFLADPVGPTEEESMVSAFRQARSLDYERAVAALRELQKGLGKRAMGGDRRGLLRRLRAARAELAEIAAIDYFDAPERAVAYRLLDSLEDALERRFEGPLSRKKSKRPAVPPASSFRNRVWVTRPRPGVDRMSSAWLIKRFIDPRARFAFEETPEVLQAGQIPFDMYGVEFSHRGDRCTFETLAERFELTDPRVRRLGEIVHDLDLHDHRYEAPETDTVGALVAGLRKVHSDDRVLLEQGAALFEALYRALGRPGGRRSDGSGRGVAGKKAVRRRGRRRAR